jgi:hypothetical protein
VLLDADPAHTRAIDVLTARSDLAQVGLDVVVVGPSDVDPSSKTEDHRMLCLLKRRSDRDACAQPRSPEM